MYLSGCRFITIYAKHSNPQILSNIGNVCNTDEIETTIKALKKYKIKINCEFTIGLPWENESSIKEISKFTQTLKCDSFTLNTAVPFPNTKFYQYAMQNQLFDLTSSYEHAYSQPVIRTHDLTKEKLFTLVKSAQQSCNRKKLFGFLKSYKHMMA